MSTGQDAWFDFFSLFVPAVDFPLLLQLFVVEFCYAVLVATVLVFMV